MRQEIVFRVSIVVDDDGTPDPEPIRKAILRGIRAAHDEGTITELTNEHTVVEDWTVSHTETRAAET